jgi:hypothetical protein
MGAPQIIELTEPQERFFSSSSRYPAFCGGFGSGKSQALFLKMLSDKFSYPDVNLLYGAPTYSLIRDIAHDRICNLLDSCPVKYRLNKAEQIIEIDSFGKILFRTLDNPDRIVGFEVFRAYLDELDTLKHSDADAAWTKVIGRCRQKSVVDPTADNKVFVATTPEGFRYVYHRWVKQKKPGDEYELIRAPTYSNPHLPSSYIESLRSSYPAQLIDAYIEGEFVNLIAKTVYPNFTRGRNGCNETHTPQDILHVGMDFNVLNMNAVVHVIRGDKVFAVTELTEIDDTPTMIDYMREVFPDHFPHKIVVYPDAYGDSKKSAGITSRTDHEHLKRAGLTLDAPLANPPIKDRVQAMNHMFLDGNGNTRYYVNLDKCSQYVLALEQQVYDHNGIPVKDKKTNIDDINDSAGYFIHKKFPIIKPTFEFGMVRSY